MTAQPDLSIITVNFNTRDALRQCLRAVERYRGTLSIEHWVIDNASADGSAVMVQEEFPQVTLIANLENLGPSRARNQVIGSCRGRYILSLDSDVFVHSGTLPALVEFMDRSPDVAVAGCKLLNEDGSHQRSAFHLPLVGPALLRRTRGLLTGRREDFGAVTGPVAVGYLKGAICIYRREAWEQVGIFDPQFKVYMEEVDLHLRFHKAGWKVAYFPGVVATHLWARGMDQNWEECQFYREYSALWFARKHGPFWLYWCARALAITRALYYSRFCSDDKLRKRFWGKDPAALRRVYAAVLGVSLRFGPLYPKQHSYRATAAPAA